MERNSIYIARIFGIPIRVHISWFIIFLLVTVSLTTSYFPEQYPKWPAHLYWIIGAITSLLFFVSVLLHELAHSIVALNRGMKVRDIVLFVFGGVSEIVEEPPSASTEFFMAFVGPLTSVVLGVGSILLYLLTGAISEPLAAIFKCMGIINIVLAVFNMVPGFPLDGGRVLRAIVWGVTDDLPKATRWAANMGVVVAYLLIALGVFEVLFLKNLNGLWLALIGWFLNNAAQSTYSRVMLKQALAGYSVGDVMSTDCPRIPPDLTLEELVHNHILARGVRCVPVMDGERLLGIVTVHSVKAAPRERWPQMRVGDVMIPVERVKSIAPGEGLWQALEEMTGEGVNQLPVIADGRLVGMLGRDAVMGFLRARAELGG